VSSLLTNIKDTLKLRVLRMHRSRSCGHARRKVPPNTPAVIMGTLSKASGIGNGARLMLRDLGRRDVSCHAIDLTRQLGMTAQLPGESDVQSPQLPPLPRIIHLNPPHFGRVLYSLRHTIFAAPVVGYWAWELEAVPRKWLASAQLADEIWVPSTFVRDALRSVLDGMAGAPPVHVVPHAVEIGETIARDASARIAARQRLGLPPQGFIAGFTFSVLAGVRRKNPEAAIAAFREAFSPADDGPTLLLRCVDAGKNQAAWAALQRLAAQDSRIRLVEPVSCDIQDFFSAIDTLLSLHRSEGYGLTLAEALRAGIPVIATSWSIAREISGNKLFYPVPSAVIPVNDPAGPYRKFRKMRWAEPDIGMAAKYLRELQAIHRYHIANG